MACGSCAAARRRKAAAKAASAKKVETPKPTIKSAPAGDSKPKTMAEWQALRKAQKRNRT